MEKLTGLLPPNIFSTSGHNLFISFSISKHYSMPGFSAKIHFGNYILTYYKQIKYLIVHAIFAITQELPNTCIPVVAFVY